MRLDHLLSKENCDTRDVLHIPRSALLMTVLHCLVCKEKVLDLDLQPDSGGRSARIGKRSDSSLPLTPPEAMGGTRGELVPARGVAESEAN